MEQGKTYKTFKSFYKFYLTEHGDPTNRLLHFLGTAILLICFAGGIITGEWWLFILIPVTGYGFAWVGHFFIENNRPATFSYPLYSLASDFVMFWHILTGQINSKLKEAKSRQ